MGSSACHYTKLNYCLKLKDQIICDYSHDILTSKQDNSINDNNANKLLKINEHLKFHKFLSNQNIRIIKNNIFFIFYPLY